MCVCVKQHLGVLMNSNWTNSGSFIMHRAKFDIEMKTKLPDELWINT